MQFLADLHPLIVHFPIAIYVIYVVFEITGIFYKENHFTKTAQYLLLVAVITAVLSALTGNQAEDIASKVLLNNSSEIEEAIEEHESIANIFIWFTTFLFVCRTYLLLKKNLLRKYRIIIAVISVIGLFLIWETAEHGGRLVYKYGIGTEVIKPK